jgi:hypothetical protein
MAIKTGRYTLSMASGNTTIAEAGKFLRAWSRLGARRILGDCWSSSVPIARPGIRFGEDAKVA